MQWQDRSTPYSVATEQREHDGRTYAINAYRDRDSIALHAAARPTASWSRWTGASRKSRSARA